MSSADSKANVFMAAVQKDIETKKAAVDGSMEGGGSGQRFSVPKFGGRPQVNFGCDHDVQQALKFARITRERSNSEIINDALRQYLSPEIDLLIAQGIIAGDVAGE